MIAIIQAEILAYYTYRVVISAEEFVLVDAQDHITDCQPSLLDSKVFNTRVTLSTKKFTNN